MRVMIGLFIKLTLLAIVLSILGELLIHWLTVKSSDKVEEDERDRLITLKAQRNGYHVLVAVLIHLMVVLVVATTYTERIAQRWQVVGEFLEQAGTAIFMANLLLLALVVTEVAVQGSRIFYYRRGH